MDEEVDHEIHRNTDGSAFWITCGGKEFFKKELTPAEMLEYNQIDMHDMFKAEFDRHMEEKHPGVFNASPFG